MAQFAEMATEPQQLLMAIQPPVDPLENEVEDKIKWLRDWLDTDAGLEAPDILRAGVGELIKLQFQFAAQVQTVLAGAMGQAQQAANQPTMEAQAQLEAQNQQPENTEPTGEQQFDAAKEAAMADRESVEADKQREHEKEIQQIEMKKDAADHQHKMAEIKAKPKPKPAKAKAA
jgi:hypothetical protein